MRYENQKLTSVTICLDEDELIDCQLIDCRILFGGMRPPVYFGNHTIGCNFQFTEGATATLQALRRMLEVPSLREMVLGELGFLCDGERTLH